MADSLLWQYPARVAPLEPSLTTAPPALSWQGEYPDILFATPPSMGEGAYVAEPTVFEEVPIFDPAAGAPHLGPDLLPVRLPILTPGWFTRPLEPTLFESPPELSWERPPLDRPPDALPGMHPAIPGWFVRSLERSLYEDPPALSWEPHLSQPVFPLPGLDAAQQRGAFVGEPGDFLPPFDPADGFPWIQDPEPPLPRQRAAEGWFVRSLERSLYEDPPALSWHGAYPDILLPAPPPQGEGAYVAEPSLFAVAFDPASGFPWLQAPEPVRRPPELVPYWFTKPDAPSLILEPPTLSWWRALELPVWLPSGLDATQQVGAYVSEPTTVATTTGEAGVAPDIPELPAAPGTIIDWDTLAALRDFWLAHQNEAAVGAIVDEDTLAAVRRTWEGAVGLPDLFTRPVEAGRVSSPRATPYAVARSEFDSREKAGVGLRWFDNRRVTIEIYGTLTEVKAGGSAVQSIFNEDTTLVYPSGAVFYRWWPQGDLQLELVSERSEGEDLWVGRVEALATSVRSR